MCSSAAKVLPRSAGYLSAKVCIFPNNLHHPCSSHRETLPLPCLVSPKLPTTLDGWPERLRGNRVRTPNSPAAVCLFSLPSPRQALAHIKPLPVPHAARAGRRAGKGESEDLQDNGRIGARGKRRRPNALSIHTMDKHLLRLTAMLLCIACALTVLTACNEDDDDDDDDEEQTEQASTQTTYDPIPVEE